MSPADHLAIAQRIGERYAKPWHRSYARNKLRFDPAYAAVAAELAATPHAVLDVGCGLGLLGFYLRERGFAADYRGLDFDAAKIAIARRIAADHSIDLHFDEGSADALPPSHGHVVLLDILHYLRLDAQQALLQQAAARVAPGGALIVRSVLRAPGWRFRATVLEEHFLYATRWMKTPASHYPDKDEIETPLLSAGLAVDTSPLWGNTPFNSFMIVARRSPGPLID